MDNMERIVQITAGRGPEECTWVAAQVVKQLLKEAQEQGIDAEVIQHVSGTLNGTVRTATILLKGSLVVEFVALWEGTIQWIGQSTFRRMHKRKNWFVGVFTMHPLQNQSVLDGDIHYQAIRSSGAGGQHVNKVSSAIRATHLPTGLSVVAMDFRSQHQNKKVATERLKVKISRHQAEQLCNQLNDQWLNQTRVVRGNPVRTFTGSDFKPERKKSGFKSQHNDLKCVLSEKLKT